MGYIQNFEQLAVTKTRRDVLDIAEAGLAAIDTQRVIEQEINLTDEVLRIGDYSFDLSKFKSIKVIGFGKVSCKAALALEQILGSKIHSGAAIGIATSSCELIKTYSGDHPNPSSRNVEITEEIIKLSQNLNEKDLVIVVVSGGG